MEGGQEIAEREVQEHWKSLHSWMAPRGMRVPPPIIKDFRGSRKPQKLIFSDLETYSIESGVIDLVE